MRLASKLLLAVLSLAGTLLMLELAARGLHLQTGFFLVPSAANCLQRSASLLMKFRPRCDGEIYDTQLHTNTLGLRGDEVADDGSVRILTVGDSCTWGWRVQQEESYPAVLQQLLDAQFGAHRYQVINAGVPGYTSYEALTYLRDSGLALHPAIVIIGVGFNDATKDGDVAALIAHTSAFMPLIRLDDFLLENSVAYRWARWRGNETHPKDLGVRVTTDNYRRNLIEMTQLARAQGAAVVFVNFPQPGPLMSQYRDIFAETAESLDVPLLRIFVPRIDLVHPTAEGYRMLAAQMLQLLDEHRYLNPPNDGRPAGAS
jgi:lysophospholipase L1-like esterase